MKILVVVLLSIFAVGCGTYQAVNSCKDGGECTSYAIVSESEAEGLASSLVGGSTACKVSVYGDVSSWKVSYKGDKCEAYLNEVP